jgi:serine/alanine adding enzyme
MCQRQRKEKQRNFCWGKIHGCIQGQKDRGGDYNSGERRKEAEVLLITVRPVSPNDSIQWDSYVALHPKALLAHRFYWKAFLEQTMKLQTRYWLAEDGQEIKGIAPFALRKHLGLGNRLTSLPYLNTGGILADTPEISEAIWQAISSWAQANSINTIELRSRHESLSAFSVRVGRSASIIPIPSIEGAAWTALRSTARNRIRKAENNGLEVRHGFEYFDGFWQAYAENMKLLGAPALSRRFFLSLAEHPETGAHLITLWQGKKIAAGMVLLKFKDGAENGWTSSTVAARDLYANDLLYWTAIRWAVSEGLKWLDLGRSQADSSLQKFKEKFGAETIQLPYQEIQHGAEGWASVTSEPEALYHAFQTVWTRLPLSISKRLGPYFSRQIY